MGEGLAGLRDRVFMTKVCTHGREASLAIQMLFPSRRPSAGMESPDVLTQNVGIATAFTPMTAEEMRKLRERCRPLAADGRFGLFKTTKMYDGALGRQQHHFPTPEKLPA